jgi:hypothetical protein
MAALAATAVTTPVSAAAPVLSTGFRVVFVVIAATMRRQPFLRLNIRMCSQPRIVGVAGFQAFDDRLVK